MNEKEKNFGRLMFETTALSAAYTAGVWLGLFAVGTIILKIKKAKEKK